MISIFHDHNRQSCSGSIRLFKSLASRQKFEIGNYNYNFDRFWAIVILYFIWMQFAVGHLVLAISTNQTVIYLEMAFCFWCNIDKFTKKSPKKVQNDRSRFWQKGSTNPRNQFILTELIFFKLDQSILARIFLTELKYEIISKSSQTHFWK